MADCMLRAEYRIHALLWRETPELTPCCVWRAPTPLRSVAADATTGASSPTMQIMAHVSVESSQQVHDAWRTSLTSRHNGFMIDAWRTSLSNRHNRFMTHDARLWQSVTICWSVYMESLYAGGVWWTSLCSSHTPVAHDERLYAVHDIRLYALATRRWRMMNVSIQ